MTGLYLSFSKGSMRPILPVPFSTPVAMFPHLCICRLNNVEIAISSAPTFRTNESQPDAFKDYISKTTLLFELALFEEG